MAKYEFSVGTDYVGSTVTDIIEIPDEDLEGLTEDEIDNLVCEWFLEWRNEHIYSNYVKVED